MALITQLVELARERGYQRLSLETGSMEAFASARRLYEGAGFTPCPPFGDYTASPNSIFMTLPL
jgi:putative acetyltransferase